MKPPATIAELPTAETNARLLTAVKKTKIEQTFTPSPSTSYIVAKDEMSGAVLIKDRGGALLKILDKKEYEEFKESNLAEDDHVPEYSTITSAGTEHLTKQVITPLKTTVKTELKAVIGEFYSFKKDKKTKQIIVSKLSFETDSVTGKEIKVETKIAEPFTEEEFTHFVKETTPVISERPSFA